jgi:hypothetical protein
MTPLSKEERQRLALASFYPTMTSAETNTDLADLRQRAAVEDEQQRNAKHYQDYMNNRWQLAHYPTMPVPEEWKPFITASTTKQDGQAQGRVASAGTESIMFSSNRQPHVGNPLAAEVPSAATPIRNDRANAREKAAQIQAEQRSKEEAEEAALRAERVKKGNPTLSDLLFHTNYSTSNGLETLPETAKHYYNVGEQWVKDNPADSAALALSPVPVAGDIAGAAADVYHYYQNPNDLTWENLGLSALGLVPWVPHGAATIKLVKGAEKAAADAPHLMPREQVMTKPAEEVRKELAILRLGGQEPVKIGELSPSQMEEILKVVPKDAGEAFLVSDRMLEATPNLVEHSSIDHSRQIEHGLIERMVDFPSKGLVYPNKTPDKKHRPVLFLYNKERDKYDMLVIDPIAVPGKITPITIFSPGKKYAEKYMRDANPEKYMRDIER